MNKTSFYLITFSILLWSAATAMAAEVTYVPLEPLSGMSGSTVSVGSYIKTLYQTALGLAVALAILRIVIGGITIMTTDNVNKKMEGKEDILQAIYGLILALSSYFILNLINPGLVSTGSTLVPPLGS